MADTTVELLWFKSLFIELKLPIAAPPLLLWDNISAQSLAYNLLLHSRSTHIELDQHFRRDQVLHHQLVIPHVSSEDQIANARTKPLVSLWFALLI